jgi:hypothetical protein
MMNFNFMSHTLFFQTLSLSMFVCSLGWFYHLLAPGCSKSRHEHIKIAFEDNIYSQTGTVSADVYMHLSQETSGTTCCKDAFTSYERRIWCYTAQCVWCDAVWTYRTCNKPDPHGVTAQETIFDIFIRVRTSSDTECSEFQNTRFVFSSLKLVFWQNGYFYSVGSTDLTVVYCRHKSVLPT